MEQKKSVNNFIPMKQSISYCVFDYSFSWWMTNITDAQNLSLEFLMKMKQTC